MTSAAGSSDSRGQLSSRKRSLLFLLPAVFFGVPSLENLAKGHYYASYWYALPTIASIVMVLIPTQRVVVRVGAPRQAIPMPWQTQILTTAFLAWVLTLPTVAVLRRTVHHHHHDLAVLLAVVIPLFIAVSLVVLLRGVVARRAPGLSQNEPTAQPVRVVGTTGKMQEVVSGSIYGSYLWLWLIMAPGAMAVFGLVGLAFSISAGPVAPALVGIAIGMTILCVVMRQMAIISVDEDGVRVVMWPSELVVLWDDIASIEPHFLSGKLVLKEPIRAGLVTRRKLPFVMLDPHWKNRPTSRMILARTQAKTEGSSEGLSG